MEMSLNNSWSILLKTSKSMGSMDTIQNKTLKGQLLTWPFNKWQNVWCDLPTMEEMKMGTPLKWRLITVWWRLKIFTYWHVLLIHLYETTACKCFYMKVLAMCTILLENNWWICNKIMNIVLPDCPFRFENWFWKVCLQQHKIFISVTIHTALFIAERHWR